MMARCAKCQQVFQTDRYGRQFCPLCGAEVMLQPPGGAPPPPAAPPPSAPSSPAPPGPAAAPSGEAGVPPPSGGFVPPAGGGFGPPPGGEVILGESTPWERRSELGFFPALLETLKRSMTDPVRFFERMRVDNADGAVSYYWLVAGIGGLFAQLWQAAFSALKIGATSSFSSFPVTDNPMASWANLGPMAQVGAGLVALALAPVALYISAGIFHLSAMLFRSAGSGFNATLRAVAYAAGPSLLGVIPACGSLIGAVWMLVLLVIAIWKLQRTSVGLAVGTVLAPMALLLCCLCIGLTAAIGAIGAASSSMQP